MEITPTKNRIGDANSILHLTINPNISYKTLNEADVSIMKNRMEEFGEIIIESIQNREILKEFNGNEICPEPLSEYFVGVEFGSKRGFFHLHIFLRFKCPAQIDLKGVREWVKLFRGDNRGGMVRVRYIHDEVGAVKAYAMKEHYKKIELNRQE